MLTELLFLVSYYREAEGEFRELMIRGNSFHYAHQANEKRVVFH